MTVFFAQIINWINIPVNVLGKFIFSPISMLPGWVSNTIISAAAGVGLLVVFKHTSNQGAIGRIRDDISANLLALKLYNESLAVSFQAQGRIFKGAMLLLLYSVPPLLVMIVPVSLMLGQMGLWYQKRPMKIGEQRIVTLKLNGKTDSPWPTVSLDAAPAIDITIGPVRVLSKREVLWEIRAIQDGYHRIIFRVDNQHVEKDLAVGNGFMRVSAERPGWHWADILLYPAETHFSPDDLVQSISIDYPNRASRTSGTDWWIVYFFIVSMVVALICRSFFNVRL